MEDKELFDSAITDEPIEQVAEQPVAEVQPEGGQLRDEQGRFAAKQAEPEPEASPSAEKPPRDGWIPSFRVREERERAEAAEQRARDLELNFTRQMAELQSRLPKQEPKPAPDVFEDPNGFLQHGVQQAVDPISQQVGKLTEFYSRKDAVREHGEEKVTAAFTALDKAASAGDPEARATVARVKQSMDPFGDIVAWHAKQSVYQQIGNDPQAWAEKWLQEQLSNPTKAGEIMQRIQGSLREQPQGQGQIKLPPSLGRVPSSQSASDEPGDMSDASLFAHAMR